MSNLATKDLLRVYKAAVDTSIDLSRAERIAKTLGLQAEYAAADTAIHRLIEEIEARIYGDPA